MNKTFDVIVLGAGGMGSAAVYHLSKRGLKVLGIDRHPIAHAQGSSHGYTRITRQAYFEHPSYIPLLLRAHELWRELNVSIGHDVFHPVGLVCIGEESKSKVLPTILQSSQTYQIPTETWNTQQLRHKLPQFHIPAHHYGVYEPGAGFLEVEACVKAHWQLAQQQGALHLQSTVEHWENHSNGVHVHTKDDMFVAKKLIITAGAWSPELLTALPMQLVVRRVPQFWFQASSDFAQLPCFAFDVNDQFIYGFPNRPEGLKICDYAPSAVIHDPNQKPSDYTAAELKPVAECMQTYIPSVQPVPVTHAVCMYTMSDDQQFVIDQLPGQEHVYFAAAGSGHAFKMTAVIGEILADLATKGSTLHPIDFLRIR